MTCFRCGADVYEQSACPGCGATLSSSPRGPRLPAERWELTAPESVVLRYGPRDRTPANAFKVALMELVARRALSLDGAWLRRRWAPGRRSAWLLGDGPRKAEVDASALVPLLALHTSLVDRRPRFGVAIDDRATALRGATLEQYTRAAARNGALRAYVERDVVGALRDRGLLSARGERTPAGDEADLRLDEWIQISGGRLTNWSHDPTWLQSYLSGAGTAVFVATIAYPGRDVLRNVGQSLTAYAPSDQTWAFALDASLDFAAIADSLEGAVGVFDVGFMGGGGDGGGGGGDGGGGG